MERKGNYSATGIFKLRGAVSGSKSAVWEGFAAIGNVLFQKAEFEQLILFLALLRTVIQLSFHSCELIDRCIEHANLKTFSEVEMFNSYLIRLGNQKGFPYR